MGDDRNDVVVADDDPAVREALADLIASHPDLELVGLATNHEQAIRAAVEHRPRVVIMDVHMPELDGIKATEEIMKRFPVPIVVASATLKKRDVDLAMKALEAGAVAVIENGPIWVRGGVQVVAADGEPYEVRNRQTLCRCGHSKNKPFCDGSHKEFGFEG